MTMLRTAMLFVVLTVGVGVGPVSCADLQPLQDHIAELQTQQERTAALVEKLIKRLAAGLIQVEEARKELQRLQQSEGR